MRERCGLGRRLVYTPCLLPNKAIKRMFDSTHACTTLDGFRLKMAKSWKTAVYDLINEYVPLANFGKIFSRENFPLYGIQL